MLYTAVVIASADTLPLITLGFFSGEPVHSVSFAPLEINSMKVKKGILQVSVQIVLQKGKKIKFKMPYKVLGLSDYQKNTLNRLHAFSKKVPSRPLLS